MAINRNNRKAEPIPVVPRTMRIVNADGTVTRSGQLLLEQLQDVAGAGPFIRTLDLFDVTPGIGIAPFVPIFREGPGIRAIGVLRLPISADLVIAISRNDEVTPLFTFTFPASTATGVDLVQDISNVNFKDLDVLIASILDSDSSSDIDGIATLTIEWGALGDDSGRGGSSGGGGGGGGGGFTAGGDLAGSSTVQTVIGLSGVPLDTVSVGSPSNDQVITFDAASGKYMAKTPSGGGGSPASYYIGGTFIGSQPALNLIAGSNATIGGANNTGASRVDITITAIVPVTSVFGRTGAILPQTGDYTAAQVTNAVDTTQTYADPPWISSLAWSKITGAPSIGFTAGGDLSGSSVDQTVIGLQEVPLDAATVGAPGDGQIITYDAAAGKYEAKDPAPINVVPVLVNGMLIVYAIGAPTVLAPAVPVWSLMGFTYAG